MEFTKEEEIIDDDFLNSLIYELTVKPQDRKQSNIDLQGLNYNHYFTDNAEQIIKERLNIKQNDPFINLVIDQQVKEIQEKNNSNLDDWNERGFINNNKNDKEN